MNTRAHSLLRLAALCVFVGAVLLALLTGCGQKERTMSTGAVVAAADLSGLKGDAAYAVVQSSDLPALYSDFRDTLTRLGLVKWDEKFDCNHFASLYIAVAQARYAVAAFQSYTTAQSLALCEVWYIPAWGNKQGHAIVMARTEHGDVYIEPQNGQELNLTVLEVNSIYMRKW